MKTLRRTVVVLLAAVCLVAFPAQATSFSTDQSDLWYIVPESGWGMQLVQRGNTIFATVFVYGPTNAPTWYVATMTSADGLTWTGDLYATMGPWFGTAPFNPANVSARKAGTMTWAPQTVETGTLSYVVDGVAVTKDVVRETLVFDDFSGTYLGGFHAGVTGCTNPANNTPVVDAPGLTLTVIQTGQAMTIAISSFGASIMISGTLTQGGQFGTLVGTYTKPGGEIGNAIVSAMNVQTHSLAADFSLSSTTSGCLTAGYLAGMRT